MEQTNTTEQKNKPVFIHGIDLGNDTFAKVQKWNNKKPELVLSRAKKTIDGQKTGEYEQIKISAVQLMTLINDKTHIFKALEVI